MNSLSASTLLSLKNVKYINRIKKKNIPAYAARNNLLPTSGASFIVTVKEPINKLPKKVI